MTAGSGAECLRVSGGFTHREAPVSQPETSGSGGEYGLVEPYPVGQVGSDLLRLGTTIGTRGGPCSSGASVSSSPAT